MATLSSRRGQATDNAAGIKWFVRCRSVLVVHPGHMDGLEWDGLAHARPRSRPVTPPNPAGGSWSAYLTHHRGREARPALLEAAARCEQRSGDAAGLFAVDLGCGSGADTIGLLARGWKVLSIDGEQEAVDMLRADAPDALAAGRLSTRVQRFEGLSIPDADLIHAGFSLPFCSPEAFPELWAGARAALRPGARFVGQFFGDRDTWTRNPALNFHTREQALARLDGLIVEQFLEQDEDGDSLVGPKHWHVFHIVAQQPEV
jgi:tellurite methyltransferase